MSYEDDFYSEENIIGYTGNIDEAPTVYFRDGNRFGRITQQHPHSDNVGRNLVRECKDYSIYNGDKGNAVEYYNGKIRHQSRNPFIAVDGTSGDVPEELVEAIANFPSIKAKYRNA